MSELRQKTAEVIEVLESAYGVPVRRSERDPLGTLIATILSQNTNDINSGAAYRSLRAAFPTWADVLAAPVADVARSIERGGLSNQKAARIQSLLQTLRDEHGTLSLDHIGALTDDDAFSALRRHKGIGVKTVACTLLFALDRDVCPVDTHVHRLANRLGLVQTRHADETFTALRPLVPTGKAHSLHVNLIRHGRQVCRPTHPACGVCVLYDLCEYPDKEIEAERPATIRARAVPGDPSYLSCEAP